MRAIHRPKGPAAEYAPLAVDLYTGGENGGGCNNGCRYCYVKRMPYFRQRAGQPLCLRDGILEQLERDAARLAERGCQDEILLCFTCDPWPRVLEGVGVAAHPTVTALRILSEHGLRWTTLTRRPLTAWEYAEPVYRATEHARFGVSLSWLPEAHDDARWWERLAEAPVQRVFGLEYAKAAGVGTWVSLEPVLGPAQAIELVRRYSDIVDEWRIGMASGVDSWLPEAQRRYIHYWTDWDAPGLGRSGTLRDAYKEFGELLAEALTEYARAWQIKKSLQPYMPHDFPARRPQ